MNRSQKKALKRIDEKIAKAKSQNNLMLLMQLQAERNKIFELERVEIRTSLKDALSNYTSEQRREATVEVIYAIATADILYGATMDVEQTLRKRFGVDGLPMMDELRAIVKKLHGVVKSIDDVGSMIFSLNYANVVEEVEKKYEVLMRNYIHDEILKSSKPKEI